MPHSYGLKARTRHRFAKGFRQHGAPNVSTYLTTYKIGDLVDIKVDSSMPKGQPYRLYHGRTGKIWNVTPRAVGVELLKRTGPKYIRKRIHVRIEHIVRSRSRDDLFNRIKKNAELVAQAKKDGKPKPVTKRQPAQPRAAHLVKVAKTSIETIVPLKYEFLV